MRTVCDYERSRQTVEDALAMRGWRIYDGPCQDFVSHPSFYQGALVPVKKALEAERIVNLITGEDPKH